MPSRPHQTVTSPFSARAEDASLPNLTTYLLSLISIKRSNLCVSADVHKSHDLIALAEEVGDSICVLKTHADIIDDFTDRTVKKLQEISERKHFLLFEDRKLGDIGSGSHQPSCATCRSCMCHHICLCIACIQTQSKPNTPAVPSP